MRYSLFAARGDPAAAADWLNQGSGPTDPWLYLIGSDGIIKNRWGPLFDTAEG